MAIKQQAIRNRRAYKPATTENHAFHFRAPQIRRLQQTPGLHLNVVNALMAVMSLSNAAATPGYSCADQGPSSPSAPQTPSITAAANPLFSFPSANTSPVKVDHASFVRAGLLVASSNTLQCRC